MNEDPTATTTLATAFEAERPRLQRIATQVLGDVGEAEDVVQQAWLRLDGADTEAIENLPGWLTTVTTRLCLDRLRRQVPDPVEDLEVHGATETASDPVPDPAETVALADTVGIALQVVLDRLTPSERVAFVLHDTFGFDFPTIASVLDTSHAAARKLASRARAEVAQPRTEDPLADWEVVDAFMAAARGGDFGRLLELLAPGAVVAGDAAAIALGTPAEIAGRQEIATFFNGAAHSALAVVVGGETDQRPGAAWYDKGVAKVVFDFTLTEGRVSRIDFRAEPGVVATVRRRRGGVVRG